MPQLDAMTFFSQFFWFGISFSFFYLFLLSYILPVFSLNIKFRKRLLYVFAKNVNLKKDSLSKLLSIYDNLLLKALCSFRLYSLKIVIFCESWLLVQLSKVNLNFLSYPNTSLLMFVGEKSFGPFIVNSLLKNKTL